MNKYFLIFLFFCFSSTLFIFALTYLLSLVYMEYMVLDINSTRLFVRKKNTQIVFGQCTKQQFNESINFVSKINVKRHLFFIFIRMLKSSTKTNMYITNFLRNERSECVQNRSYIASIIIIILLLFIFFEILTQNSIKTYGIELW